MSGATTGLQVYLVGGAVRDALLGLPVGERDWVVVGATADVMRARGFEPVDDDFPVFRHPHSGDEYALARRETKRGVGYRGFTIDAAPDVTLEQDLRRRDLTINAIAQTADGTLIDPFHGRDDLDAGLLRHVSPAFDEDPLRVLRIARFAARFGAFGFRVAHGTQRLMRAMVERGDLAHLAAERLWRELSKAMASEQPWRFFEVLHRCGALAVLIPPLAAAMGTPRAHSDVADSAPIAALKRVATRDTAVAVKIAATLLPVVATVEALDRLLATLRADRASAKLLRSVVRVKPDLPAAADADPHALYALLKIWHGFDRDVALDQPLAVADAQFGHPRLERPLTVARNAASSVSVAALRAAGASGAALGERLAEARLRAIGDALRDEDLIP